jgi:DNA-binding response OmpR family regulator
VLVLPLDEQFYRDNHLFVHLRHEVVMLDGEAITLTCMQHRLLALLLKRAGEAVPRATILMQLCGGLSPRRTNARWLYTCVRCEKN